MAVVREKLYEEVWAEPMLKVAARYGVSSSFLACVCTRMRVLRPERGYWPNLLSARRPAKPPLPDALPGDEPEWSRSGEPRRFSRDLPRPPDDRRRVLTRPNRCGRASIRCCSERSSTSTRRRNWTAVIFAHASDCWLTFSLPRQRSTAPWRWPMSSFSRARIAPIASPTLPWTGRTSGQRSTSAPPTAAIEVTTRLGILRAQQLSLSVRLRSV